MIKKLNIRVNKTNSIGFFHDSRVDVKTLATVINTLIDKTNELVEIVSKQEKTIMGLKNQDDQTKI